MHDRYATVLHQSLRNLLLRYPELADDEVLRLDMIEGATDLQDFMTELVRRVEDTKTLREGTKQRLEDLRQRAARFDRRHDGLRDLIKTTMEIAGLKSYEMPEATVSMKRGQPRVLGDADPAALPDEFCRITREADKAKIRQALLDGQSVTGFVLSNPEPILTVHVR